MLSSCLGERAQTEADPFFPRPSCCLVFLRSFLIFREFCEDCRVPKAIGPVFAVAVVFASVFQKSVFIVREFRACDTMAPATSLRTVGQIGAYSSPEVNMSVRGIMRATGKSMSCVKKWRAKLRWEARGGPPAIDNRFNNLGRTRSVDEAGLHNLAAAVVEEPFRSHGQLAAAADLDVCDETVRRALKVRLNSKSCRAAKKIVLEPQHRDARLRFVQAYGGWPHVNWRRCMFVDEKSFSTDKNSKVHVVRTPGTRYEVRHLLKNKHSGRATASYWGCFSYRGAGRLTRTTAHMDRYEYLRILETELWPAIEEQFPDNELVYVIEDNHPVHTTPEVRAWYAARRHRIYRLFWPAYSPDLNPIENWWHLMQQNWRAGQVRNVAELNARVRDSWDNCAAKPEYYRPLADSMPSRIAAVQAAQGGPTKY